MAVHITPVTASEFPAVNKSMWDAYENPPQHLFRMFCPENPVGCTTRAEALKESADRLWEWHATDPSSYWIKATDDSGAILGGAFWKFHKSNPYAHPPEEEEEAYWMPEGGQRDYANQFLAKHEDARSRLATRAHAYLNIIFVHPDHQRKGVGAKLSQWGIDKAKEEGVEMWLNGWKYGVPLYEKMGFTTVSHHIAKPETEHPDAAWEACAKAFTDLEEWVMWRPKDGPYVEGVSKKPWEHGE